MTSSLFARNKFLLRQKHLSISEKYIVWDESGQPLLYVTRPTHILKALMGIFLSMLVGAVLFFIFFSLTQSGVIPLFPAMIAFIVTLIFMAPKRHVTFYADENNANPVLQVIQTQHFVFLRARYEIRSMDGQVIATLSKNWLTDIFRKRWVIHGTDGTIVAMAKEDSFIKAFLRRFLGPLFGILRTNFIITKGATEDLLGAFNRTFTLLDRYILDLSQDGAGLLDRRVALALGVMLDTGEKR